MGAKVRILVPEPITPDAVPLGNGTQFAPWRDTKARPRRIGRALEKEK